MPLLDCIIEHRFFKPVSVTIIVSFILFQAFSYLQSNYSDTSIKTTYEDVRPIKINISALGSLDVSEDQTIDYSIKSGDTLLKVLMNLGAPEADVFAILSSMKKYFPPQYLISGSHISIKFHTKINYDPNNIQAGIEREVVINSVTVFPSVEEQVVVSRKNDGSYDSREVKIKLLRYVSKYQGVIKEGLFVDGVAAGVSANSMMNMINLYGYDVDFQRDIHDGDKFEILVETFYDEAGKKVKDGNVLFSSLTLQNRAIENYMFKSDGRNEYFDAKGNSVRKSLLRTPINGARVSSGFGLRRHPILGYSKMHKGTDFAAPTGTPIMAAGNGTIVYMAVKGGYGNYVQIKHNAEYSTAYGHASRFNKKFHAGAKVKQGDIVAYVGTTGRSTGPHLHFELLHNGSQINPAKVKATSGIRLAGKELVRFQGAKAEIDRYRKSNSNKIEVK